MTSCYQQRLHYKGRFALVVLQGVSRQHAQLLEKHTLALGAATYSSKCDYMTVITG